MVNENNPDTSRKNINLNNHWKFSFGYAGGAENEGFDDYEWQAVDLPHTWNNLDGQDGGGDFRRGDGWYRKSFSLDISSRSKKVYIQFDGACLIADVYLNGIHIGQHRGAFATFRFDITEYVRFDTDNLLVVRVNNEINPEVAPYQKDGMDSSVDFTLFGGIYRDVSLLITEKLQIDPLFYSSCGVFIKQRHVSESNANIEIITKVFNHHEAVKAARLVVSILDAADAKVAGISGIIRIESGEGYDFVQSVDIPNPQLWNGLIAPYLYRVYAELLEEEAIVDAVEQPLGLRYFHIDANEGFSLNGSYYDLHGVSRHQDRENMGWAIADKQHLEDFNIMMELGCTMIRMAHYQHAQYYLDLCDRYGMAVWSEVCLVGQYVRSDAFDSNILEQLKELMYQNMNHPSIVCWGLLNEISNADAETMAIAMNELCHRIDSSRLTTLALHGYEPKDWGDITDLEAHNKYFGWYTFYSWTEDRIHEFAAWADGLHERYPAKKIGISEYGAGANIYQHEDDPQMPDADGQWHPEEYQCLYHEEMWKMMKQRKYLWCKLIWNAFDFASDPRNEGDRPGINDKGLVTYDRKIKKDAYYFYKANWTREPFVYITGRRFTDRNKDTISVKIYSNCPQVRLMVNAVEVGALSKDNRVYVWEGVALKKGWNRISAVGKDGAAECMDVCEWNNITEIQEKKNDDIIQRYDGTTTETIMDKAITSVNGIERGRLYVKTNQHNTN